MNEQSAAKFGFKPSAFRRHDPARIGDTHQLVHGRGVHRYCHCPVAGIDQPLQFLCATNPANEVDPTGAGDGFCGAFLVEYHRTGSAVDACRFASAAASLLVEGPGVEGAVGEDRIRARMAGPTREQ